MRVLVLNWRDPAHPRAGGAEVYTDRVVAPWVAAGDSVTWLTSQPGGLPDREIRADGVEIIRGGGTVGVYAAAWWWWCREGRQRGFDLIIDEINTIPFGAPLYPGRPPVMALIHQTAQEVWHAELGTALGSAGARLEPHLLRAYRQIPTVTVSASSKASLERLGLQRVTVLPQGTDPLAPPGTLPDTHGRPTLIWCGRLANNKQPLHAIEAARLLAETTPGAQLWMLGDGPRRAQVEAAAASAGNTTVFGHVPLHHRNALMAAADLLIATSVREGWGLTVSEAAELGTPAVGYRVPGLVDSIPASGGLLCDPRPEVLTETLTAVLRGVRPLEPRRSTIPWTVLSRLFRTIAVDVAEASTPGPCSDGDRAADTRITSAIHAS